MEQANDGIRGPFNAGVCRGWGFLPVVIFGSAFSLNYAVNVALNKSNLDIFRTFAILFAIVLMAAVVNWMVGRSFNQPLTRVRFWRRDSLLAIPMEWWSVFIVLFVGATTAFVHYYSHLI
jgi:hypothetical protein